MLNLYLPIERLQYQSFALTYTNVYTRVSEATFFYVYASYRYRRLARCSLQSPS